MVIFHSYVSLPEGIYYYQSFYVVAKKHLACAKDMLRMSEVAEQKRGDL
jgi:hypothetical protein